MFSLLTNSNPWVLLSVTSSHSNSSWLHPFLPSYLRAGLYQDSPTPTLDPALMKALKVLVKAQFIHDTHPRWAGRELWKKCSNQKSSNQDGLKEPRIKWRIIHYTFHWVVQTILIDAVQRNVPVLSIEELKNQRAKGMTSTIIRHLH